MSEGRIQTRGLGVRFDFDRQKRVVTPLMRRLHRRGEHTWALRGIDLEVKPGESIGLIGPSGSGKTTLLRAIARIIPADEGTVSVQGHVGSLLAVDGGLLGALNGRENAETLSVLSGLSRREARKTESDLKEMARLGDSFERPVATYSQGMRARLGFAVAESASPRILLLDEVFEAMDRDYRKVLEATANDLTSSGGIVMVAGHDLHALSRICDRAIEMREGSIVGDSPFSEIHLD